MHAVALLLSVPHSSFTLLLCTNICSILLLPHTDLDIIYMHASKRSPGFKMDFNAFVIALEAIVSKVSSSADGCYDEEPLSVRMGEIAEAILMGSSSKEY